MRVLALMLFALTVSGQEAPQPAAKPSPLTDAQKNTILKAILARTNIQQAVQQAIQPFMGRLENAQAAVDAAEKSACGAGARVRYADNDPAECVSIPQPPAKK